MMWVDESKVDYRMHRSETPIMWVEDSSREGSRSETPLPWVETEPAIDSNEYINKYTAPGHSMTKKGEESSCSRSYARPMVKGRGFCT